MLRPVTLFTGQWADPTSKDLAPLAKEMATMVWNSPAGATTSTCKKHLQTIRTYKVAETS